MKSRICLILVLVSIFCGVGMAGAALPGPTEQLRGTIDRIIETLRDRSLPRDEMLSRVSVLVRSKFDFWAMSQRTLAVNWNRATPEQRQRFVALFSQLLEDTYRERIGSYTYQNEYVKYISEKVEGTRGEVHTIVVANNEIPVTYRVRLKGQEWLVYDVVVEEVSLISNYRSTYNEIVRREGMDGLLKRMEQRIRELQAANKKGSAQ
ncbi:ABC transporter substrate-binding protein [Desulfuromonas sp. CSMB_57]|jgi:phospholipid transport system substrate-binding protein|uniref:MlaC/ttg2D family ABC transporter substrate-binding protein n=1 Tax=Desulfuromonas sp. CSMB_57 TaxID=2807629 RepID=UPI001CD79D81|nr:ABC transporter substrate-binding protein [Desulfuromonas sp. CSMB_57]